MVVFSVTNIDIVLLIMKGYFMYISMLVLLLIPMHGRAEDSSKLHVLATTSIIKSILVGTGGENIVIEELIPAGMCPGHFDLKPRHLVLINNSAVIFYHGWEPWINGILKATNTGNRSFVRLQYGESLSLPEDYRKAVQTAAETLSRVDPGHADFYLNNARRYSEQIKTKADRIKQKAIALRNSAVICAEQQASFLRWLGMDVIATYGRDEELTPQQLISLIKAANAHHIKAVVDNLQSGRHAGETIAHETGSLHIILSSFPLDDSYLQMLDDSMNALLEIQP
jgi:ABC-type Zn uptake system ZnuABC Zn-binding protein ZnuA